MVIGTVYTVPASRPEVAREAGVNRAGKFWKRHARLAGKNLSIVSFDYLLGLLVYIQACNFYLIPVSRI